MIIKYRNSYGDILAFCFYHYPRSPFVAGSCAVSIALISLVATTAASREGGPVVRILSFFLIMLVASLFFAALFAISVLLSISSSKNKSVLTEHTITLTPANFTEETAFNKMEQNWAIVQKLARTRNHIFIYIAQHMAHVIPRRAFSNDAEWNAFYDYCRERTKSA